LLRLSRSPVCDACWADLPRQTGWLCLCCGEALGAHAFADENRAPGDYLCRPCRVAPPHFDRAVAYGLYRGTLRSLLHLLKYDGVEPIARHLGSLLADLVLAQPALPRSLTVVPVPLYAGKRRERGFNQAALLAEAFTRAARARGWTARVETDLLIRKRATMSQAGLTRRQRRDNVRAAFAVPDAGLVKGKDILIIDDIYTTGATARATSMALGRAGASSVWVATVARAQRQETMPPVVLPIEEDVAFWN
jgi:ComF family protein